MLDMYGRSLLLAQVWFRTLHSMAFHMLGLSATGMMTRPHYKELYKELRLGMPEKLPGIDEEVDSEVLLSFGHRDPTRVKPDHR